MKKKINSFMIMVVLLLTAAAPVLTIQTEAAVIPEERQLPRVVDNAELLTDSEEIKLRKQLDKISESQKCDVAVVTVNSLEGKTSQDYADDFYDYNGYGMGVGDDGILLLISMEERDWAITTYGFGITAFTDAGMEYIAEQFKPDLSSGDYIEAFTKFAELSDDFLTQARNGKAYNIGNMPKKPFNFGFHILIAVVIGFALAFITVSVMKGKLKSVRQQSGASDYVRKNSMQVTESRDMFLYHTINRRAKPKNSSSSGSSSTHSSSSGRSHGGSSGKF